MDSLINAAIYASSFLGMLTILVFVHEWGHYIIARLNGVRVDVFSIGFGPEIWGRNDKNGTRWKVSAIPLGGYVKFFGDASAASTPGESLDEMTEDEKKESFHFKKLYQRAAIVFAGPLANFIFAILILATLFYLYGQTERAAIVSDLVEGKPAAEAGMQVGDKIVAVDGDKIDSFQDVVMEVLYSAGESLEVEVLRDGQKVTLTVVPQEEILEQDGEVRLDPSGQPMKAYRIGVQNSEERIIIEHTVGTAIWAGVQETGMIVKQSLRGIRQMIVGTRSVKELSGPIGISQVTAEAARRGVDYWVWVMALISISLGMINLFPIPLLDGGHLLYYGFEAALGRKLSERTQEFGFRIGLVLVLGLMMLATFNDILKFNW